MFTTIAISLVSVLAFGALLGLTGIVGVARQILQTAASGLSAMTDPEMDDDAKEVAVRRAGFTLLGGAFAIGWRFALAVGAAALPLLMTDAIGLVPSAEVLALMLRLDYIVGVSIAMVLLLTVWRRTRPAPDRATMHQYSATDRFFHELAFASPAVLRSASWLEDQLLGRPKFQALPAPIFITSLARGGTTALLNAMYTLPGMASHIYRDMPLVTAPMLWHHLSGGDKRRVERHQRAHGDGLEIDLDTPEAFEEIVWKMGWPEKYHKDGIDLWHGADHDPKAEAFLRHHMAKVVSARYRQGRITDRVTARYVSKNNANITRIGFLRECFPDCRIVVPVRRPDCHAASLLRQHRNFLKRHAQDDFVRRYMRDIGHFEFGQIHRPFLFPDFTPDRFDPAQADYWLAYWIGAFRHIHSRKDDVIFVSQDDLRAAPQATMERLCKQLEVPVGDASFDRCFRPEPDVTDASVFSPALLGEAYEIYGQMAGQERI